MRRLLLLTVIVLIVIGLAMLLWRRLLNNAPRQQPDAARPSSSVCMAAVPAAAAGRGRRRGLAGTGAACRVARQQHRLWSVSRGALLVRRGVLSAGKASVAGWPMKTLGAVLVALATGTTAWLGVGHHPVIAIIFALLALLGCYLTYGFDLKHGRRIPGIGKQAA
jgi:hypothetical protein